MRSRQEIAEALLDATLEDGMYAPCPGRDKHSKGNGRRDFRVILDGAPTGYCFHSSCGAAVDEFNKELRAQIWREENGDSKPNQWTEGVSRLPKTQTPTRPELDEYMVWEFTRDMPEIDEAWFARRSPVAVSGCSSLKFLESLYQPGERVLIFTSQYSQGDFLTQIGKGSFRLSPSRGTKAVKSELPKGAKDGIWFMVQPVTGQWAINPKPKKPGEIEYTRRSEVNVTAWRFYVLESDVLAPAEWLKVLANFPLPIAAIYTSGRRSIHALVKAEVVSKSVWDQTRNLIRPVACPLGADPAALSAVRLSRLPGCFRGETEQRLIYLNPDPPEKPIRLLQELQTT